jgi:hypothetical protein
MAIIVAPAEAAWIAIKQIGAACCAPNAVNANSPKAMHAAPIPNCQQLRARAAHQAPSKTGTSAAAPFNSINDRTPLMSATPPIRRTQGRAFAGPLLKTLWNSTVAMTAQRAATSKTIDRTIAPVQPMAMLMKSVATASCRTTAPNADALGRVPAFALARGSKVEARSDKALSLRGGSLGAAFLDDEREQTARRTRPQQRTQQPNQKHAAAQHDEQQDDEVDDGSHTNP